jgi:hypothetical protein
MIDGAADATGVAGRLLLRVAGAELGRVFIAIAVDGVSLDALVVRLGSSCNAIYKTVFDARRKVRAALVADGYLAGFPGEAGLSGGGMRRS